MDIFLNQYNGLGCDFLVLRVIQSERTGPVMLLQKLKTPELELNENLINKRNKACTLHAFQRRQQRVRYNSNQTNKNQYGITMNTTFYS